MAIITQFKGFKTPVRHIDLSEIIKDIKTGKYKEQINRIRVLSDSNRKEDAQDLKKRLDAFTPSGKFERERTADSITTYSNHIILDFDDISEIDNAFKRIIEIPYTKYAFRSPRGNGIKVIVGVKSGMGDHYKAFNSLADYYEDKLMINTDRSGKDLSRLCFVSHDPETYINEEANYFNHVSFNKIEFTKIRLCADHLTNSTKYCIGNRNNFIYKLALECSKSNINKEICTNYIIDNYDLSANEIISTINSAYKRKKTYPLEITTSKNVVNDEELEDELLKMPTIPIEVYDNLPEILSKGCYAFEGAREKDLFLTGALTILSGCFSKIEGTYDQRTVYANLNCFIIAPAASGKGAFAFAKTIGKEFHKKLLKESEEAIHKYKLELQEHINAQKSKKRDSSAPIKEEPTPPPHKKLFIPGNSSSASIIQHLASNDGKGIFCETEADTIANSLKQDWGGYSDLLRKAFHHESVSYSRKTNNEYYEVDRPQLSMAISGTPSQVAGLINSSEDGLFSRIIFYVFKDVITWRNVSPVKGKPNLNMHFDNLSVEVLNAIEFLEANPTEFTLSTNHWEALNSEFSSWLNEVSIFVGDEATSIIKRLGLILFRICMIITALRKYEDGESTREMICGDQDFETALKLTSVYKVHALYMFKQLPKSSGNHKGKTSRFYESLPNLFKRAEALKIGEQLGIKERTTDKYLKAFINQSLLVSQEYGVYAKV